MRPSEEDCNSVSPGGKAVRRSPQIEVKALKTLLLKNQNKAKELSQEQFLRELMASKEVEILKELEKKVHQLDASLHCEL